MQSFCLRVTAQECLQTDWPGLRPAGASDRFKNTATDSGARVKQRKNECTMSSRKLG